ncbi:MAG: RDD family protein [Firmicutes bacterium]|nr:RDD family protein [Bacillota bacterium]
MDKSIKIVASYIIDIFIIALFLSLITNNKYINPYKNQYYENYERYQDVLELHEDEKITEKEFNHQIQEINYNLSKYNIYYSVIQILTIIIYLGIFPYYYNGQTFGKKWLNLKIVHKEKKEVKLWQYIIRMIILNNIIFKILIISGIFLLNISSFYWYSTTFSLIQSSIEVIIFMMIVLRKDARGIHDFIAKTKVITIDNKKIIDN